MTQPADELRAAAARLRAARFGGAMTATPAVAALLRARQPLADWLDSWTGIDLSEHAAMPEDVRHALAVARQVLGTTETPVTPPAPTPAEQIRDRVNERLTNCVWITVDDEPMVLADSWPDARALIDAIHTAAGLDGTETPAAPPAAAEPCEEHGPENCHTVARPARTPATAPPFADRADLRDRIAAALDNAHHTHPCPATGSTYWTGCYHPDGTGPSCHTTRRTDAVLAVLPAPTDQAAEEHRLALSEALGLGTGAPWDAIRDRAAEVGTELERRTLMLQASRDQVATLRAAAEERPLDPFYTCEPCGFRWAGKDSSERLPERDGELVCPRCELQRLADEAQQPETEAEDAPVVAYRNPRNPHMLFCRTHGERWAGLSPLTSQDLPHGGICTVGHASGDKCGRDVLSATKERR